MRKLVISTNIIILLILFLESTVRAAPFLIRRSEDPWLPSLHVLNCEYIKMLNLDLFPLECEVKCLALSKQKSTQINVRVARTHFECSNWIENVEKLYISTDCLKLQVLVAIADKYG